MNLPGEQNNSVHHWVSTAYYTGRRGLRDAYLINHLLHARKKPEVTAYFLEDYSRTETEWVLPRFPAVILEGCALTARTLVRYTTGGGFSFSATFRTCRTLPWHSRWPQAFPLSRWVTLTNRRKLFRAWSGKRGEFPSQVRWVLVKHGV